MSNGIYTRQSGAVVLLSPLIVLICGTLLLSGVQSRLELRFVSLSSERQAIQLRQQAHSALAWGRVQTWEPVNEWQCKSVPSPGGQVCVRLLTANELLLAGRSEQQNEVGIVFWLRGTFDSGVVTFSPHGWSDFCPETEQICQLP